MKKREIVKKALEVQDQDDPFNKALARVMSEEIQGKIGYKKYMDLIEDIREISRDEEISVEEAAERYLEL
ncbi:MAG: hypothetical protein ACLFSM_10005 [Thermoplasmata archaeon]